jgi:hypothetical protein
MAVLALAIIAVALAGCAPAQIRFQPGTEYKFEKAGRPLFQGKLGIARFADHRSLPFHVDRFEAGMDYFRRSGVEALREAVMQTLLMGEACSEAVLVDVEPLFEPTPERLQELAERHPDLDYILSGGVEALNVTNQHMGTVDVRVGNVDYNNLPYFSHRLRIRVHMEIYSLRYNQLVWGDVIEGLGHEEYNRDATQALLDGAYRRFCLALYSSLINSATVVSRTPEGDLEFDVPDQKALVEASVQAERHRKLGLAEDYERVHREGQAYCRAQAKEMWQDAVARVKTRQAAAVLLNTFMKAMAAKAGKDPSKIQQIDLTQFERELKELGADTSSLIHIDIDKLVGELVHYDPVKPKKTDRKVRVLGEEFTLFKSRHADILSQLNAAQTAKIASATDRTYHAFIRDYGGRNRLRERLAAPQNRPVILVFKYRRTFSKWCAGFGGPKDSGGFQWYLPKDHPLKKALTEAGFGDQVSTIAVYWYGYRDREGHPLNGIVAMWCTIPHELGHHVHHQLLSYNIPPFQNEGFSTTHEYPVDFAGNIRFGQFENPSNAARLKELHRGGAIPFLQFVDMEYNEISRGGTNFKGYVSSWLFYLYLKKKRPQQLIDFETRLAGIKRRDFSKDKAKRLFMQTFGLRSMDELRRLGEEAVRWGKAKKISEADIKRAWEAYRAVSEMSTRSYNYRLRAPARMLE